MKHEIPFGNSNRENGPTFLDFPLFLGIFQWDEPTKRVPFTAEPEIPEILTKWKAPRVYGELRLRTVSLFSWSVEQNARDTQMTTRLTEGARRERQKHSCSASAIINLSLVSIVDSLLSTLHASANRILRCEANAYFIGSG